MIAHVTARRARRRAQQVGEYADASLARDGFPHCPLPMEEQLLAVADAHFLGCGHPCSC